MRTSFLPFHLPLVGEEEIRAVTDTLRSGWLTTGPSVRRFEQQFGSFVGAAHSVAVNSATAALHLALDAIGLQEGDEVLVPTMTFAATAEVVTYFNATPVLIDSQPDTLNLDPEKVEAAITPRTRAIIPVHFAGHPCDMPRLMEIAKAHRLMVIEDAAHALPAYFGDDMVGSIGDITCFSFYATKTITTGEGGMITTERQDYAERIRMMSLHGISKDAWKRYTSEGSWYYEILEPGYKYNLTDIAAAIGIEQLAKCRDFWRARRRIAERYHDAFADLPEIQAPVSRSGIGHSWHLYVIQLRLEQLSATRDEVIEELKAENIGTSVHFIPLHLHPYYRTRGYQRSDFPVATAAFERMVSLPIYPRMTDEDVEDVIDAVRRIVLHSRRSTLAPLSTRHTADRVAVTERS
ncbi:MAG: aminotransferase class I/II-fold pyridoxal phosphate-dependent enzyme [Luteitalea sp.]|nr:aminotransferase class I/II-fold pyridoxal phosphate-dependent enzyme [Luteitalea sp.]